MIAELKKDIAADKKASQQESFAQKQEMVVLRNEIVTLQNANAILAYKSDAFIKQFANSKISDQALASKNVKAHQEDDGDFDGEAEEQHSIDDREDFRQSQYGALKELIEKNHDEIHMVISDIKQEVMDRLSTRIQKSVDGVAGDLAEHVAQIADLKESKKSGDLVNVKEQIDDLWKAINPRPKFDLSQQRDQSNSWFAYMDKPLLAGDSRPNFDLGGKNVNFNKDNDNGFPGDAEETRSVDFRQCQHDILKEHIDRVESELHVAITDNKKYVMTKLAAKFQKRLDVVAGDLAEHVAQIADLKESGDLVNVQHLHEQVNDLKQQIEHGWKTAFNIAVEAPDFDQSEHHNHEKIQSSDFKALKQDVYEKFKLFAGEVDKELKRMNMKLGGLPVTSAKREEMEAYLVRVETKMDNVQHWVATINQKLVDSGMANLVGPHS